MVGRHANEVLLSSVIIAMKYRLVKLIVDGGETFLLLTSASSKWKKLETSQLGVSLSVTSCDDHEPNKFSCQKIIGIVLTANLHLCRT